MPLELVAAKISFNLVEIEYLILPSLGDNVSGTMGHTSTHPRINVYQNNDTFIQKRKSAYN